MLIQILTPDFEFKDARGELTQLCRDGYKQFNIVYSHQGVVRGNHYHKISTEVFFVIDGKLELAVSKNGIAEKYVFAKGDMFLIPPYVVHSFKYLENTTLAAMYDIGVEREDGMKDIWVEEKT